MPLERDPIEQPLSKSVVSDAIRVTCKFSPNEQTNFEQKIEEASLKYSKIAASVRSSIPRVAFIRLHTTAIFPRMVQYAKDRMIKQDLPFHLDGLILYQSSPIRDSVTTPYATSEVVHHVQIIDSPQFALGALSLQLSVPIGIVRTKPAYNVLKVGSRHFEIDEHYSYQSADLYLDGMPIRSSTMHCTLGSPAAGFQTHVVLPNGRIISARPVAEEEEFLIM